jgi:hypothetical protein
LQKRPPRRAPLWRNEPDGYVTRGWEKGRFNDPYMRDTMQEFRHRDGHDGVFGQLGATCPQASRRSGIL